MCFWLDTLIETDLLGYNYKDKGIESREQTVNPEQVPGCTGCPSVCTN